MTAALCFWRYPCEAEGWFETNSPRQPSEAVQISSWATGRSCCPLCLEGLLFWFPSCSIVSTRALICNGDLVGARQRDLGSWVLFTCLFLFLFFLIWYLSGFGFWAPCLGTCSRMWCFRGARFQAPCRRSGGVLSSPTWQAAAREPAREIHLPAGGFTLMQTAFLCLLSHPRRELCEGSRSSSTVPFCSSGRGLLPLCLLLFGVQSCWKGFWAWCMENEAPQKPSLMTRGILGCLCCPMSMTWLILLFDSWKLGPSTLSKAVGVWACFFFFFPLKLFELLLFLQRCVLRYLKLTMNCAICCYHGDFVCFATALCGPSRWTNTDEGFGSVCVVLCGFLPLASPPFNPVAAALPLAAPGSVVRGLAPRTCVRPRVRWALGCTSGHKGVFLRWKEAVTVSSVANWGLLSSMNSAGGGRLEASLSIEKRLKTHFG